MIKENSVRSVRWC